MYNKLQGEDKRGLEGWLPNQKNRLQTKTTHWQSANLSRARALKLLQELEK
jgi:hypothetical protein